MLLSPDDYPQATVVELLREAAKGRIPKDRRWVRAILERGESCAAGLIEFLNEADEDDFAGMRQDILYIGRHFATPAMLPALIEFARRCEDWEWPEPLKDAFRLVGEPALEPLLGLRREMEDPYELDEVLASLGVRDPRIVEALAEQVDQDPVLGSLLVSIYNDPEARPLLEKALASVSSEMERFEIRDMLKRLGEPRESEPPEPFDIWSLYPEEGVPAFAGLGYGDLVALLESPAPQWRAGAAAELRTRGELAADIEGRLLALAREDPDAEVRGACWWTLARSRPDPSRREEMLARLGEASRPLAERRSLLLALADTEEDDALVTRWILDFYDQPSTRAVALEAMRFSANANFAPYVSRHLADPDLEVRRQAVLGVGTFGLRAEMHRLPEIMREPALRREALASYAALAPMEMSRRGAHRTLGKIEQVAGGLSVEEAEIVTSVLDDRFVQAGRRRVFGSAWLELPFEEEEEESEPVRPVTRTKIGRNEPCPCGSGRKYKKCCGA